MCDLISGYQFPDGSLHFHDDADVEAAWERAGKTEPIHWANMVGHGGWRFCFGDPPAGAEEIEGLVYLVDRDLRLFAKLMKGAGYTSLVQRNADSVAGGRKLWAEGIKLRRKGDKLCADGIKLRNEGDKLHDDGIKLRNEGYKLWADGTKLRNEGDKLWAEGDKLCAGGTKLRDEGEKLRADGIKLWDEGTKLWAEGAKLRAEGDKLCFDITPA
jgi:hypothetical protein